MMADLQEVEHDPFAGIEMERAVPTTAAQREIWLADQQGREASLAYNESVTLHINGRIDVAAVGQAVHAVTQRHEALRSTVSPDGASLLIQAQGVPAFSHLDLRSASDVDSAETVRRVQLDAVCDPFDLGTGPLLRAQLITLTEDRHELIITCHHIVCDGWSFGILARDLMREYARLATGSPASPPPKGFSEYAQHQLEGAFQQLAEADAHWWAGRFPTVPVLELPLDRPRSTVRTFESQREDLTLPRSLVDAVQKAAAKNGVSLFVALCTTFAGLMSRLGGRTEVVVGVPAAGQNEEGFDSVVGHCVQLLPMLLQVDPESSFAETLKQNRGPILDSFDHQACTFGTILQKLKVEREAGRLPLVSVLFNLDAAIRTEDLSVPGIGVELESNPRRYENFELFLNATQRDGEIVLELQYNSGLFDGTTVRRWLELYRLALTRAVADPGIRLAAAFAPTEDDMRLLQKFNDTAASYDGSVRIEELISAQAVRTPDAIAVACGDRAVTYRELDARSASLAQKLIDAGAAPGQLVGLCCGRSEQMVVALVGILKSGAGYVPLDPGFPDERLRYMCADARLRLVVADETGRQKMSGGEAKLVGVEEEGAGAYRRPANATSADVAYVIYTSGSTGKPKGVRVPHASVVNLLHSVAREPGMSAKDSVLSVTTLSFDIAVSEVILPLTVGARIVVASKDQVTDGDRLRQLVESERITFVDATPSTWRLLLSSGWQGGNHVRAICTGEPLPPDLGRALIPMVGELWNGYGPTETTVWSTFHRVLRSEGVVPIGKPVANTQIHVVDDACRALPIGVIGNIYIAGAGVTIGYLERPELTAERFISDPTGESGRWYKTGDLGRWRTDGVLECMGRSDNQVKIRGYRIELGEIEATLANLTGVAIAVVVVDSDESGAHRLIGFVEYAGGHFDEQAMREQLKKTLPDYMVPGRVIRLPSIPLLPNGKVNRNALPKAEAATSGARADATPPRTDLERKVRTLMEEVLRLPGIGVRDSFFALGGHSLLAVRLTAKISRELSVPLSLRSIFEAPTVEQLARVIEGLQRTSGQVQLRSPIARRNDQSTAPLTVMQERIRFMEELYPGRVVYNTPSAHRLSGELDRAAFERALNEIVARQSSLRSVIEKDPVAGGYRQRFLEKLEVKIPFHDLSGMPSAEREAALMAGLQSRIDRPMDIYTAPLFDVALFRLGPSEHVFLFMPHHIMWDGWSFDLLYREMSAIYGAYCEARLPTVDALEISYGDFAEWHRQWLQSPEARKELDFWKRRFAGMEVIRAIPVDRPRKAGMSGTGAVCWIRVDKPTTEQLRSLAHQCEVTLNMVTLAAHALLVGQATQGAGVVLGIPVRGRLMGETETVMGFFNNLLPFNLKLDTALTVREWLAEVKRQSLALFSHQDLPFEVLSGEPEFTSISQKAGLYQSLFSFQDARERIRTWGNLRHQSVLVMQKGATEDFGLWLMDVAEGLEGGINYNADIFDEATAELFRARFLGLLRRMLEMPDASVGQLLAASGPDVDAFSKWLQKEVVTPVRAIAGSSAGAAASTPEEQRLAQIWSRLLGVNANDIAPQDNFFDLGGNSMLVMQAVAEMERESGQKVDPQRYVVEPLAKLAGSSQAAGRSARLEALAAIWAELLGLEAAEIQGTDNFFDLGGNSLLVMKAVALGEQRLGIAIDPQRYVVESLGVLVRQAAAPVEEARKPGTLGKLLGAFGRRRQ